MRVHIEGIEGSFERWPGGDTCVAEGGFWKRPRLDMSTVDLTVLVVELGSGRTAAGPIHACGSSKILYGTLRPEADLWMLYAQGAQKYARRVYYMSEYS